MLASTQGMGAAMPNLAFSLIMKSMQKVSVTSQPPSENQETHSPTAPLADSHHHIDVRA